MTLAMFPEHALDLSLHTAILVGLVTTWIMHEWFGWVFAGFVVSGYLGALAWLAPWTLMVVLVESVLTYGIVWALAAGLSHTRTWSRVFGRERFLLFVLVALTMRLLVSGLAMPRLQRHLVDHGVPTDSLGAGLFGIGVVLVPLMANTFWKLGITRGLRQVAWTGGITWAAVAFFGTFTNLGFGEFSQGFDALAIHPFESSRVVLVMVCTVFIAAHNNLRYGWDFGGILVPALLAVLIFTPARFISTIVEIGVLFVLYEACLRLPVVRDLDLGGPRRVVSVYALAWAWKWALALVLVRLELTLPISDLYGFGYLLTSLVVARCHKTGSFLVTTTPIVWTSLQGVLLAAPLAAGLSWLGTMSAPMPPRQVVELPQRAGAAMLSLTRQVRRERTPSRDLRSLTTPPEEPQTIMAGPRACAVASGPLQQPAPDAPYLARCGGDGPVLTLPSPLGDPDSTWLGAWMLESAPALSGLAMASVDPTPHPTHSVHAASTAAETVRAALELAGDRPVVLLWTRPGGEPTLHPRGTTDTTALRAALGLPDARVDPRGPPEQITALWELLRAQDGVLALPTDVVDTDLAEARLLPWHDIGTARPSTAPSQPETLVHVLLPAVRRALARPPRARVPGHLRYLAELCGAEWARSVDPEGTSHWVLLRRDDTSDAVDRWVFRPGGSDWTVFVADGRSAPGTLAIALHHHLALRARATWLGARPAATAGHHSRTGEDSLVDQISRQLLAPVNGVPQSGRAALVEVAPQHTDAMRVSRGGAHPSADLLADLPAVRQALDPWPGARAVEEGSIEASWVPSLGLAVHYTRALRPDGLVVLWYPRQLIAEARGSRDRPGRLAWYEDSSIPVVVEAPPAGEPIEPAPVLEALTANVLLLTDGTLRRLESATGWRVQVIDHGLRLQVVARSGDQTCAALAGAPVGSAWTGCWRETR